LKRKEVLTSARLAGLVKRYHTWPTLTVQSVGEHTWQVLRIYIQIFGAFTHNIVKHIIWHDCGELAVGDPPFPLKANDPHLKAILDLKEEQALAAMGVHLPDLPPEDKLRVKICDLVEMNEFGIHEWRLGNTYADPIIQDTREKIRELGERLGKTSPEDQRMLNRYFKDNQGVGLWLYMD
jgi:hypothetical protein